MQNQEGFLVDGDGNKVFSLTVADRVITSKDGSRNLEDELSDIQTKLTEKEPVFSKNTAFNKNFGNTAGTVCEGNDARLLKTFTESSKFIGTNANKELVTLPLDTTSVGVSGSNVGLGVNVANVLKGSENVAIGNNSLAKNTSCSANIAIGSGAMQNTTNSMFNIALGSLALDKNTSGSENTAIGVDALRANTTGSGNTAIGFGNISKATTGSNNIAIGNYTYSTSTNYSNTITIGNSVNPTASNSITIGSSSQTTVKFGNAPNMTTSTSGHSFGGTVSATTVSATTVTATNLNVNGKTLLNWVYPVGSIYMSVNSTNPSSLFGGTWVVWGSGRVPVSINTSETEFNTVEKTGGSKYLQSHSHSVSLDYTGNHNHNHGNRTNILAEGISDNRDGSYNTEGAISYAGSGNSQNLQPYITCYMWKRTA